MGSLGFHRHTDLLLSVLECDAAEKRLCHFFSSAGIRYDRTSHVIEKQPLRTRSSMAVGGDLGPR